MPHLFCTFSIPPLVVFHSLYFTSPTAKYFPSGENAKQLIVFARVLAGVIPFFSSVKFVVGCSLLLVILPIGIISGWAIELFGLLVLLTGLILDVPETLNDVLVGGGYKNAICLFRLWLYSTATAPAAYAIKSFAVSRVFEDMDVRPRTLSNFNFLLWAFVYYWFYFSLFILLVSASRFLFYASGYFESGYYY